MKDFALRKETGAKEASAIVAINILLRNLCLRKMVLIISKREYSATYKPTTQEDGYKMHLLKCR
jgi:hypothetical protein